MARTATSTVTLSKPSGERVFLLPSSHVTIRKLTSGFGVEYFTKVLFDLLVCTLYALNYLSIYTKTPLA